MTERKNIECLYKGLPAGHIVADHIEDERTTYEFVVHRSQSLIALVTDFKAGERPPVELHYMDTVSHMRVLDITKNTITLEKSEEV